MRPLELLGLLLAVLIVLLLSDRVFRRRRSRRIAGVGADFRMNYSPLDRFALTDRLGATPEWSMRAADLSVKDVLYATREGTRWFIATVKCRWSFDEGASRYIVRILEHGDHSERFELAWESSPHPSCDEDVYRRLMSSGPVEDGAISRR